MHNVSKKGQTIVSKLSRNFPFSVIFKFPLCENNFEILILKAFIKRLYNVQIFVSVIMILLLVHINVKILLLFCALYGLNIAYNNRLAKEYPYAINNQWCS